LRKIASILRAIFVVQFYRTYATLFYIILFLAAGFMRGNDHIALGSYFVSNPILMGIPAGIWSVYSWLVIEFNKRSSSLQQNSFLNVFIFFPPGTQLSLAVNVSLLQLLPVLCYGVFLVLLSLMHAAYAAAAICVTTLAALSLIVSISFRHTVSSIVSEKRTNTLYLWILKTFRKPMYYIFVEGVIRRQPLAMIGYKVFSLLVLWAAFFLYTTDEYDLRLAGLGVLTAFTINTSFVHELHRFENSDLHFLRQQPVTLVRRFCLFLAAIILFTLPELLLVMKNSPPVMTLSNCIQALFFGVSIPALIYSFLFSRHRTLEKAMPFVYFLYLLLFIAVLFKIPLWLMSVANLILSAAL